MNLFCDCNSALGNTGHASCLTQLGVAKKTIQVPLYDSTGQKNAINLADFVDGKLPNSYIVNKLNETDPFKRWYPLGDFENVAQDVPESVKFTTAGGTIIKVKDSPKIFTGIILGVDKGYLAKVNQAACVPFGVYVIDEYGALEGTKSKDGTMLYPTAVSKGSWDARYKEKTDTEPSWLNLMFSFDQKEKDANRSIILPEEMDYDMLSIQGLIDVTPQVTVVSATQIKYDAKTSFGSLNNPIRVKGMTIGNLVFKKGTTVLTPTALTEEDGVYTIDFPAQTANDVITVSIQNHPGYDFKVTNFIAV